MATSMITASNVRSNKVIKIYILVLTLVVFLYLNTTVGQRDFSDTDTYLFYIDTLYFFKDSYWWTFEGLSKALMIGLRKFALDTEYAIQLYRYILILLFPLSIYYIYRYSSWQALLISLALYGPLLGLITMRATPAYVLATLAAVSAMEGKRRSIAYLFGGFLFHLSTALAVPATLMVLVLKKYGVRTVPTKYLNMSFFVLLTLYVFATTVGSELFSNFISSFSYLAKYMTYVPGSDGSIVIGEEAPKLIHYAYAAAVVGLSLLLIIKARTDQGVEKLFVAFSMIFYLALFNLSSPVVSLRYSPFFILPALAWIDISFPGSFRTIIAALIALGSVIIFGLSLQQVIYVQ